MSALSPTWPHVLKFAERMEAKLAKNRHKGDRDGWLKCTPLYLYTRMMEEQTEVLKAMKSGATEDVANECADVANFAMMLADAMLAERAKR